jgi:hypothetical protein
MKSAPVARRRRRNHEVTLLTPSDAFFFLPLYLTFAQGTGSSFA